MPRLILLALLVGAGWWLVKSLRRQLSKSDRESPNRATGKAQQGEKLVACEECGLHLPQGEAIRLQNPGPDGEEVLFFCGREHQIHWQRHHD